MSGLEVLPSASRNTKPKLLERVRETIRRKHYSLRTEITYVDSIKKYILFHHKRHPAEMGSAEMEQFLNYLAVQKGVAASTQNQALSALVFLYREVLRQDFDWMQNLERAKTPARLPVVLTETEGPSGAGTSRWPKLADGRSALWLWLASDGVPAPAGERCRLHLQSHSRA